TEGERISPLEFSNQMSASKTATGVIVDEEIAPSSPNLNIPPWTVTEDQLQGVAGLFTEIGTTFGKISPHMITNPEVLARLVKNFINNFMCTDWATVPVSGQSVNGMIRNKFEFRKSDINAMDTNPDPVPGPSSSTPPPPASTGKSQAGSVSRNT